MVPSDRLEAIGEKLRAIAKEHEVLILYACESGSRAWGIESPDSDWDVRFIYVHPRDWYLSIHDRRDVIELMEGDLDFSGWDLKKALQLAYKSNPSLLEWLHSPIVYDVQEHFADRLKGIMRSYSAKALMHHYISLASRQVKAYWKDRQDVSLKKYLYAVRPVMAVQWMAAHPYDMPPVDFRSMLSDMEHPAKAFQDLRELLARKSHSTESMGRGRYPALDAYIAEGIRCGRKLADEAPAGAVSRETLDLLFLDLVTK